MQSDNNIIRVFIGSDESQYLASRVLAWSIKKHTSQALDIQILDRSPDLLGGTNFKKIQRTGFSFYRFAIPELCKYQGKAIYLDADMLVFDDIANLWNIPFNDKFLLCSVQNRTPQGWHNRNIFTPGRQFSVMLLNCEQLPWRVSDIIYDCHRGQFDYEQLMFHMCILPKDRVGEQIPAEWNHLEFFKEGETKLLHYTVGHLQPWLNSKNPLCAIWLNCFRGAFADGAISKEDVVKNVCLGFAKPSLLWEVRCNRIEKIFYITMYFFRRTMRAIKRRLICR